VKKTLLIALIVLLLAAALLQWGLDGTPAGASEEDAGIFPSATSLLDLLGGARQYLAFTFFIKTDKLSHLYYNSFAEGAEMMPYFVLITRLDPNYISAYYVGSGILDALGRADEAIAFTRQGIEANPEDGDLYYSLGVLYLEEQRYAKAREAFELALEYESEIVSRNLMLTSLAASCKAMGDEEGQRKALMEKALFNQVRLYDDEYTYEQGQVIIEIINNTLNSVVEIGSEAEAGASQ